MKPEDSLTESRKNEPEAAKLAKGIPKSHFWATDPNGLEQGGLAADPRIWRWGCPLSAQNCLRYSRGLARSKARDSAINS